MSYLLRQNIVEHMIYQMPDVFRTGHVIRVVGLVVEAYLPHVPVGALCEITCHTHGQKVLCEVIGLKGDNVSLMPLGHTEGIQIGDHVSILSTQASIRLGDELLGRIVDGLGNIIDDGPTVEYTDERSVYQSPVPAVSRKIISTPLSLGIRAIDGLLTCARGQRMAIMAGSGVGKSTLLGMMARNTVADVNVIGLIGERGREVGEFITNDLGAEGMKRSILIVATSDTPALVRMRAAFVATTIAEYFRDQGKNVLLMMDSLTRFAMASREVGLSIGEPPTMKGYTPSLFSILPRLLERVGTTEHEGSITGLYTILTEGDDIQDPIADAVRAIVDGHIVLSRKLASLGHYPPIDVLGSISRVMNNIVEKKHKEAANTLRKHLALYTEMEDYIKIGVYSPGKNAELDLAVNKNEEIKQFLRQYVEEQTSLTETQNRLYKICMD